MASDAEPEQVTKLLGGMAKVLRESAADAQKDGATLDAILGSLQQKMFMMMSINE